ncbi:MAG TPA: NADPH-dependent FMN reductase [Candidatus Paceibacterota bacterium]|nr:NADPH-dependent FMN reductase [Candidatus Paceibacterota bacterium]
MNIIAISGSLRKDSFNTALLRNFKALAPTGMKIEIADISALPLYNGDAEASFPAPVRALKDTIAAADGIIIATPEYNRSIPGVLKNVIDWVSRPYGQNSFAKKPVLVAGISAGNIGTAVAQSHLKQILLYLDAEIIGQPELYLGPAQSLFDGEGIIKDGSTKELLVKALETLKNRVV